MNSTDTVSIIVPVYGVEKYLRECVDSLLSQTYKNLEITLVDDESPDQCPLICDEYAEKDSRVKVYHKKNGGAGSARNLGIDKAQGSYICFVDGDDVILPNYVSSLYEHLKQADADIAVCNYYNLYKSGVRKSEQKITNKIVSQKEYLLQFLNDWTCSLIWDKIYKHETIESVRFPIGNRIDDEFFTYQVVMNSSRVVMFDEALYEYRMRKSSVMGDTDQFKERMLFEKLSYLTERFDKVTTAFPELTVPYLRNLLDNFIILHNSSGSSKSFNQEVTKTVMEYKPLIKKSSLPMKQKLMFWYSIWTNPKVTSNIVQTSAAEEYFQ